jgi:nucleolar protein 4
MHAQWESLSLATMHPSGRAFTITTQSRADAAAIIATFNGTTLQSLGFEGDGAEDVETRKSRVKCCLLSEVTDQRFRRRRCRLIVRNLAFQANKQLVMEKLDIFGPIIELELPMIAVKSKVRGADQEVERLNPRGFCFITFLCEKDSRTAVESSIVEGESRGVKICNRLVAIDYCQAKDKYLGKDEEGKGVSQEDTATKEEISGHTEDEVKDEDYEEDGSDEEEDGIGEEHSNVDDDDNNDDDYDEKLSDDDDDAKDEEADVDDVKEEKQKTSDVDQGCTVFVRDLSFDTTVGDLRKAFSPFGFVSLALLVKDRDTGTCKGSAFVKFGDRTSAANCVAKTGERRPGPPLLVRERPCRVDLAVDRESADKLRTEEKGRIDKRHLYLALEGHFGPATDASVGKKRKASEEAVDVPEEDREKRARYHAENKKKLLNPLFFVSPKRLSVRNLSKFVDDKALRKLCVEAVKEGLAQGLVAERDLRALEYSDGNSRPSNEELSVPKFNGKAVKTSKVMLDLQRAKDGKPQSRGFGFVDFSHHAYALACLRRLNNNPAYVDMAAGGSGGTSETPVRGPSKPRLIIEFSLENKRKVMILEGREQRRQERELHGDDEEGGDKEGKSLKKKRKAEASIETKAENVEEVAVQEKRELTPAARKRKLDQRRREKERKRKIKKEQKLLAPPTDETKPGWGGFKRLRAQRKGR